VDSERGLIHRLVNVPGGWAGVPLGRLLAERFGCACAVDNDANVVALGEWKHGAGRFTRHGIYLTLGTGVGGGVVVNGTFVRGALGTAGELGHMNLRPDGPACACGSRGCLEVYVGAGGIVRRAKQAARSGGRMLKALARQAQGRWSAQLVNEAADAGDPAARRVWEAVGEDLGIVLAGLVNLLNPERIVIGGRIVGAWRWFAPALRSTILARAFRLPASKCRIVRATLGDAAGIIGAAMLVSEQAR
jgi:predicted NBD/HSP70 family sugar kinase